VNQCAGREFPGDPPTAGMVLAATSAQRQRGVGKNRKRLPWAGRAGPVVFPRTAALASRGATAIWVSPERVSYPRNAERRSGPCFHRQHSSPDPARAERRCRDSGLLADDGAGEAARAGDAFHVSGGLGCAKRIHTRYTCGVSFSPRRDSAPSIRWSRPPPAKCIHRVVNTSESTDAPLGTRRSLARRGDCAGRECQGSVRSMSPPGASATQG